MKDKYTVFKYPFYRVSSLIALSSTLYVIMYCSTALVLWQVITSHCCYVSIICSLCVKLALILTTFGLCSVLLTVQLQFSVDYVIRPFSFIVDLQTAQRSCMMLFNCVSRTLRRRDQKCQNYIFFSSLFCHDQ